MESFLVRVNGTGNNSGGRLFRITPADPEPSEASGDDWMPVDCRDIRTRFESQAIIEWPAGMTRELVIAKPQVRDAIRSAYYNATSHDSGRYPDGGITLPDDFTVTLPGTRPPGPAAGPARAIVQRFSVQPGLWLAIEDSHCLLLQITTPDGSTEIARSQPLSDGDSLARAVELARVWVAGAEDDADSARMQHLTELARERRSPRSG